MFSKRYRVFDSMEFISNLYNVAMHIVLQFEKPSDVQRALKEVLSCHNAFHTKGIVFWGEANDDIPIYKIPSEIKELHEIPNWMYHAHPYSIRQRMGTIACDDTRLSILINHSTGDGDYCLRFVEHLCNPEEHWEMPQCPHSPDEEFKAQIQAQPITNPFCAADPNLSRILPKNKDDYKNRHFENYYFTLPINQIKGYSEKDHSVHSISENMWRSLLLPFFILPSECQNGNFHSISTVFNMRRLLPKEKVNHSMQNFIAAMPVSANPDEKTSLKEFGEMMRNDFNRGLREGNLFSHLKTCWEGVYRPWRRPTAPGVAIEMSSMGPVKISGPVKDAFVTLTCNDKKDIGSISLLTYAADNENTGGERKFIGQMQYNTGEISAPECEAFTKEVIYAMTNFDDNMTVGEALNELRNFQKKQ